MTDPTPTAPAFAVDELLPPLTSAEKPEAIAPVLLQAVMKLERDTKPSVRYLLDLYTECLDTVYGERTGGSTLATAVPADAAPIEAGRAIDLLEAELFNIDGVANCLVSFTVSGDIEDPRVHYLAGQLKAHYEAALEAYGKVWLQLGSSGRDAGGAP